MCNTFDMLVELNDWRYIAQCEHKTVHLRWDHLTISLPPCAFLQLARHILAEATAHSVSSSQSRNTPAAHLQPKLRLRLNTVLVEFAHAELLTLRSLLQRALALLTQGTTTAAVPSQVPTPLRPSFPQVTHLKLEQYQN